MKEKSIVKDVSNNYLANAKKSKGITLIALVITIIVLLILAGVSISTLTGPNGLLTRANDAKEETRAGAVQEARDLWFAEKNMDKQLNQTTAKTLEDLINELVNDKYLTEDEKDNILGNASKGIKAQHQIKIGNRVINFKDDEINWKNFEPGLYETGTNKMIKSWEQLLNDGEVIVEGTQLTEIESGIQGDLIISNSVESLKPFGSVCGYENKITGIKISDNVKEIPDFCFQIKFSSLIKIVLPSSVTSIGQNAFKYCNKLQTVYYDGTEEEWKNIQLNTPNEELTNANIICNQK